MALSMAERGRLGGLATVERHGAAHMSAIGRKGFLAYARRLGFTGGGARQAVRALQLKGRIRGGLTPERSAEQTAEFERTYAAIEAGEVPY